MTEDVMFNSLVDVQKGWINIRAEAVVDQPIRDQDFRLLVARTFRLADGTLIEEGSGLEFGTRNNQVMQAIKAYALGNEEELEKYDYNNLGINLDAKRKGYGLLHSDEGSYIVSEEPFRQIANEDTARIHLRGEAVQLTVCHRVYKLLTTQDIEIGDQTIPAGTVFDPGSEAVETIEETYVLGLAYTNQGPLPLTAEALKGLIDGSTGSLIIVPVRDQFGRLQFEWKVTDLRLEDTIIPEASLKLREESFDVLLAGYKAMNIEVGFGKIFMDESTQQVEPLTIKLLEELELRTNGYLDIIEEEIERNEGVEKEDEISEEGKEDIPARLSWRIVRNGTALNNKEVELDIRGMMLFKMLDEKFQEGKLTDLQHRTIVAKAVTSEKKAALYDTPITREVLEAMVSKGGYKGQYIQSFAAGTEGAGFFYYKDENNKTKYAPAI